MRQLQYLWREPRFLVYSSALCRSYSVWGTELSGLVYSGEGFVSRSMQRITGAAENPVANGYVSGGNNYRTGATQLEVALQEQPEETLYLKGFTGSEYAGGEWKPADERVIFQEIASALPPRESSGQ